jgi:hypothetical protein
MDIARGFVTAVMFAGLAVGAASTAWAAPPTMSGHYIKTVTDPTTGHTTTNDWYFTPCGDGCASVTDTPSGQPFGQARLVNGQWAVDTSSNAACVDGTSVPNAVSDHYMWDANTLAGKVEVTINVPSCGQPAGHKFTVNVQLRQAP